MADNPAFCTGNDHEMASVNVVARNSAKGKKKIQVQKRSVKRKRVAEVHEVEKTEPFKFVKDLQEHVFAKVEDELKCHICTEIMIRPAVLNCTHMFCEYCIEKWKKEQETCPICREDIEAQVRAAPLDTFLNKIMESISPEQSEVRRQVMGEREKSTRKVRRSQRIKKRNHRSVTLESSHHLRQLIEEVLTLASHFTSPHD